MRIRGFLPLLALVAAMSSALAAAETKRIDVNGTSLAYVDQGSGTPIVLVHGVLGDYRTWSGEMDDFAAHHRVIAYSLRYNYPDTWTEGAYTFQVHIDDLTGLLRALNLGPVHLVGHSYGGVLAALVARDHPELVRTLVLAEASIGALVANDDAAKPSLGEMGNVAKTAMKLVQQNEPQQAAITFMDLVNATGGGFKGLPEFFQAGMLQNTSTLKPLFAAPPPPPFSCDEAKTMTMPVLLVVGEKTQLFRRKIMEVLGHCLTNATLADIPGVGHPLEMMNPKDFNATVLRFVANH